MADIGYWSVLGNVAPVDVSSARHCVDVYAGKLSGTISAACTESLDGIGAMLSKSSQKSIVVAAPLPR